MMYACMCICVVLKNVVWLARYVCMSSMMHVVCCYVNVCMNVLQKASTYVGLGAILNKIKLLLKGMVFFKKKQGFGPNCTMLAFFFVIYVCAPIYIQ